MAQFDVFRNHRPGADDVPYLLDIQSDLIDTGSRVVVPLIPLQRHGPRIGRLNPQFEIAGAAMVMATADLAAIDERDLHDRLTSLLAHRSEIAAAVDFLLLGY